MNKIDEIKVKIDDAGGDLITISVVEPEPSSIDVEITQVPSQLIHLDIRRTLDNNYIIYDHPLFDIVINQKGNEKGNEKRRS